jgi:broad specificity phosphatase PhoE
VPEPTRLTILTYPDSVPPSFPGAKSLDDGALERCRALSPRPWARVDAVWCAPEPAARQVADALGLSAAVATELAPPAFGRWTGQLLERVAATDPEGLAEWASDPHSAPHGGETLKTFLQRIGERVDALDGGRTILIVHPLTASAAATHALDADPRTILHLDVPGFGLLRMTRTDRWRLQRLGRAEEPHA